MRTYTYILLPTLALLNWGTTITHAYPSPSLFTPVLVPATYQHDDPLVPRAVRPTPSPYPVTNGAGVDPNPNSPRRIQDSDIAIPTPLGSRQIHNADYGSGGPPSSGNSDAGSDAGPSGGASPEPSSKGTDASQSAGNQKRHGGPLEAGSGSLPVQVVEDGCSEELDECAMGRGWGHGTSESWVESRAGTSTTGRRPIRGYEGDDEVEVESDRLPRAPKDIQGGWWKRQTTTASELPVGENLGANDTQLDSDHLPWAPEVVEGGRRKRQTMTASGLPVGENLGANDAQLDSDHLPWAPEVVEGGRWERRIGAIASGLPVEGQVDANDVQFDPDHITRWTRRDMSMMVMRNRLSRGNVRERGSA